MNNALRMSSSSPSSAAQTAQCTSCRRSKFEAVGVLMCIIVYYRYGPLPSSVERTNQKTLSFDSSAALVDLATASSTCTAEVTSSRNQRRLEDAKLSKEAT